MNKPERPQSLHVTFRFLHRKVTYMSVYPARWPLNLVHGGKGDCHRNSVLCNQMTKLSQVLFWTSEILHTLFKDTSFIWKFGWKEQSMKGRKEVWKEGTFSTYLLQGLALCRMKTSLKVPLSSLDKRSWKWSSRRSSAWQSSFSNIGEYSGGQFLKDKIRTKS